MNAKIVVEKLFKKAVIFCEPSFFYQMGMQLSNTVSEQLQPIFERQLGEKMRLEYQQIAAQTTGLNAVLIAFYFSPTLVRVAQMVQLLTLMTKKLLEKQARFSHYQSVLQGGFDFLLYCLTSGNQNLLILMLSFYALQKLMSYLMDQIKKETAGHYYFQSVTQVLPICLKTMAAYSVLSSVFFNQSLPSMEDLFMGFLYWTAGGLVLERKQSVTKKQYLALIEVLLYSHTRRFISYCMPTSALEWVLAYLKSCTVLEVWPWSSLRTISEKYRQQSLLFHPDKCNTQECANQFQAVSDAYQFLK